MTQVLRVSKPGYNAVTDSNPDHLNFSSEYNTLKYSLANGSVSINIDTQNDGVYREVREVTHGLGYRPFFKVYIQTSILTASAYMPVGFFSITDTSKQANANFNAYVDTNKLYLVATGRNSDIITTVETPGTPGGLQETFTTFYLDYVGEYPVGNTPGNTGQCTGLANLWVARLGLSHIWGDAKDMMSYASDVDYEKIYYTPGNVPQVGDLVTWNGNVGGGAGHVAVASGSGNANYFQSFDQNWTPTYCHLVDHSYSNVMGFIRPRNQSAGTPGGISVSREPHHLQYSVTFKYKIFKNNLGL